MKLLNVGLAVLGGVALGAALGIAFAPDKGSNTRAKIAEYLKQHGYIIPKEKFEYVVDQIEAELRSNRD